MPVPGTILVVGDEARSLEAIRRALASDFEVIGVRGPGEAEAVLAGELVQVVLCEQDMRGGSGLAFLKRVREQWPDPVRLMLGGTGSASDIVARDATVHRVIAKPWRPEQLVASVREATALFRQQKVTDAALGAAIAGKPAALPGSGAGIRRGERRRFGFEAIVHAEGSPITGVIGLARRATEYDISVLITGASGTGKELLARAIHHGSARAGQPFVVENCGALPDQLLESELFGCKRGAFTGAYQDRVGLFEVADGGTIFLDEIGETSPSFQVKLLRVLQEGEIRPLGAQRTRKVNVRVVSATNRDLETEVAAGRFRRDLYYRLAAFPLHIPSLADRAMDIPPIAARILKDVNLAFHRAVPGFVPDTLARMMAYDWPGNVRELHNEIQRMVALSDSDEPLTPNLLSPRILSPRAPTAVGGLLKDRVEALEKAEIEAALARCNGNISHAADRLGLSRVGLRAKMQRYRLRRGGAGEDDGGQA
jgi:two-component system response regulator HupR/HoxA